MDYHLVTTAPTDEKMKHTESGTINGGMLPKDPTELHLVIVIDVPSVEEHLKKIKSTGGKIVMPAIKVGEYGFVCQNF